jgi:hypothetical protein
MGALFVNSITFRVGLWLCSVLLVDMLDDVFCFFFEKKEKKQKKEQFVCFVVLYL